MSCGCEILIALVSQIPGRSGAPGAVLRFVDAPPELEEQNDRRFAIAARDVEATPGDEHWEVAFVAESNANSRRLADVRPFPLFDAMNGPRHRFERDTEGDSRSVDPRPIDELDSVGLAPGATSLVSDARFADVDFDGDEDLVLAGEFGRSRLFLNDGHGHFSEASLLEGRDVICAARFLAFEDLDGDGRPELFIAAPSDPVGAAELASRPPWLDGLARRVQRDAAAFVEGGVVISCSKEGRRDVTVALGLEHLAPFRCGSVADVDRDGAPEIVLFGGESDDMKSFWKDVVPTFARVGADPAAASVALAALAPASQPFPAPRILKRGVDGRFAPMAAEFPADLANFDVASMTVGDFDHDDATDFVLVDDHGEKRWLRNVTHAAPDSIPPAASGKSHARVVDAAFLTPAPAFELAAVNGTRVRLDASHARPLLVVRLDAATDAAGAAALSAEARALDGADVILLDGAATDDTTRRARSACEVVSAVMAGDRAPAPLLRIDGDGFVDTVAGGVSLAPLRDRKIAHGVSREIKWMDPSESRRLAALPRAEREAHLPNVALAALKKLEDLDARGLDLEMGFAYAETRKPAEAAIYFHNVEANSPDYPRAQLELGRCLARTNRVADARAAFERAVDAAPADPVARFELGRVLLQSKEKSDADAGTESLRVATYLKPEFADAQYAFGQGLARIGRHEEAITALERALALAPESPQAKPAHELLESLRQKKGP